MTSIFFEESAFLRNFLNEYTNNEDDVAFDDIFNSYYFRVIRNQHIDYIHEVFNHFFEETEMNESMLYTLLYYMSKDYVTNHETSIADTEFSSDSD